MKKVETNTWKWRDGEIGYKSFQNLPKKEKQEHINFLISLGTNNLSTNDWYILNAYGPSGILDDKSENFLSLT